jgi:hypothetical protein
MKFLSFNPAKDLWGNARWVAVVFGWVSVGVLCQRCQQVGYKVLPNNTHFLRICAEMLRKWHRLSCHSVQKWRILAVH